MENLTKEELLDIMTRCGLDRAEQLDELAKVLYYGDKEKLIKNYKGIDAYEDMDLYDYGKKLVDGLNLDIPEEIYEYINFEGYAEVKIEEDDKCYATAFGYFYTYPWDFK